MGHCQKMIVNITMPKSRKIRIQQSMQHFGLLSLLSFGKKSNLLQHFVKFTGRSFTVSESSGSTAPNKACSNCLESQEQKPPLKGKPISLRQAPILSRIIAFKMIRNFRRQTVNATFSTFPHLYNY